MNLFRHLLLWTLVAVAGALLAQVLIAEPGRVVVRYGGLDYATSLGGALILGTLGAFALWLLWTLLTLPLRAWRRRRERTVRQRFGDGLLALHEGRWERAERLLAQSSGEAPYATAARVGAARATAARGDAAADARHLTALQDAHPAAHGVLLAERALAAGDARAALDALAAIPGAPPPRALVLQADALAQAGRAGEAWGMLGALRQQQALDPAALAAREQAWAAQALREAVDANALADLWDRIGDTLQRSPDAVTAYAERAAALRWEDAACASLEQAIDAAWNPELAAAYGALPVGQLERRRGHAERWRQAHPSSPGALLGLARVLIAERQWPQAEALLHRAVAQGGGADVWETLGHGYADAGDEANARRCLANALRALRGEPAQPLPGRDLRQQIADAAAIEDRDTHGLPRLRD